MKKRIFLMMLLFVMMVGMLAAQQMSFKLKHYPVDGTAIKKGADEMLRNGLWPCGVSFGDNGFYVLYLGNFLKASNWVMREYTSVAQLKQGVSQMMKTGYMPNGMAGDGNKIIIMYLQNMGNKYVASGWKPTAWQIVEAKLDLNDVQTKIQPWINQKYIPLGISVFGSSYLCFLAQIPGTSAKTWNIQSVAKNGKAIVKAIQDKISQNKMPFGILVYKDAVNLLFVGF